jgi:hypothetical protein
MAPMNSQLTTVPEPAADAGKHRGDRACSLIITVESGVVADILPTGPVDVVIVDLDLLENDDSFEQRMRKSVLPMTPESRIAPDDIPTLVTTIVQEYRRPSRKCSSPSPDGKRAA